MTDSVDGWGDSVDGWANVNGDIARLFSPDGLIDPGVAAAISEHLSLDHGNGRVPDPQTIESMEPDTSGFAGLAPVSPEDAFPGAAMPSLKTGFHAAELDLALGQLGGHAPSESGAPTNLGDPGYYFVPSPPAPAQDVTARPGPADSLVPTAAGPADATAGASKTGFTMPALDIAVSQLAAGAPTESGALSHPGDPGYYFAPSPPGRTQDVTGRTVPVNPSAAGDADPSAAALAPLKAGFSTPALELALGQLAGDMPTESAAPAYPGDPGYYFVPSPPAPAQQGPAQPSPVDASGPVPVEEPMPADPTDAAVASLEEGSADHGLGQLRSLGPAGMPTESAAPTAPGDPGAMGDPGPAAAPSAPATASAPALPAIPTSPPMAEPTESVPMEPPMPSAGDPTQSALTSLGSGLDLPALDLGVGDVADAVPTDAAVPTSPAYYFLPMPAASEQKPPSSRATLDQPASLAAPAEADVFDVEAVRRDFPILETRVHGQRLVWLDNAATTQKPQSVIDRIAEYYATENSNVHRGAHTLAARATEGYEGARETVRRFLGASSSSEIIFTRGTTEAVNLVAQTYGRTKLGPGDEILLTTLEHHSNIVPWQLLAAETGAVIRVIPINDAGEIMLEQYGRILGPRTKLVAMTHVSNALGTIVPVREMTDMAHRAGAGVLVDGAQAVAHFPVDVQWLDADFYTFSGHKLFAPTGIGALYGKSELLEEMPPWQGGGSMIDDVTFEHTTYAAPPQKFEAGTPIIAGAIGLGAAIDYLERLGLENVSRYERVLTEYATAALGSVTGLIQIGTAREKVGVFSFIMEGIPTEQIGRHLDQYGIAVRAGHHCAQPTLRRFGLEATVRPSLAIYNTIGEIDLLVDALERARTAIR